MGTLYPFRGLSGVRFRGWRYDMLGIAGCNCRFGAGYCLQPRIVRSDVAVVARMMHMFEAREFVGFYRFCLSEFGIAVF